MLSFDFLVQSSASEDSIQAAPKEGAYVKDMILEGAKWDFVESCLLDADPMMLFNAMPIVLFKPVQKKKATATLKRYSPVGPVAVLKPNLIGHPIGISR